MSVMSTTFTALAFNMTFLREQGVLKRMRGTPMPGDLLPAAGSPATRSPTRPCRSRSSPSPAACSSAPAGRKDWFELIVFVTAGVVCFASLGVAFSHAIPNFDSAPAYVNAVFLPVIFISGVFYDAAKRPGLPQGDRAGAAAQAPDRRALGRDGHGHLGSAANIIGARRDRRLGGARDRARGARLQLGAAAELSDRSDRERRGGSPSIATGVPASGERAPFLPQPASR